MLRAIINILLLVVSTTVLGQPIYFNKLYSGPSVTENMFNVLWHDNGYVFVTVSQDVFADTGAVTMIFIDLNGVEITRTEYVPDNRNFNAGRFVEHADSGYVYLHSITDTIDGSRDFHLIRYDDYGDVVFTREYAKQGDDICFWGIQCIDGGFALCGQAGYADGEPADIMLIRTDDQGNELWRQIYGGSGWEGGSDLIQTPDDGFLLLGWTRSFGSGQKDFYLVKTDNQGNEQWSETYGESTNEVGESIIRLMDGNYLLTGSASLASGSGSVGRLYKIDGNGDVIWSNSYSYPGNSGHNFRGSIEASNGDLLSTGLTNLSSDAGWLVRTDNSGDLVWQREYDRSQHIDFFYHVIETSDGGFLLSGQAVDTVAFSQDAWLLKVDSVGCPYPNCITGVDEKERTVLVDVWPNPATDVLNIEKVGSSRSLDISVFDLSGREMLYFTQNDNRVAIDVSSWMSGVYVLQGTDEEGRSFSMKVAKQ